MRRLFYFLFLFFISLDVFSQDFDFYTKDYEEKWVPLFPKALFISTTENSVSHFPDALFVRNVADFPQDYFESTGLKNSHLLYYVQTLEENVKEEEKNPNALQSPLLNNDIFALYGKPGAGSMGILGQYKLEDLDTVMEKFVKMYDAANGRKKVISALYIIYGTVWPKGEIGVLDKKTTERYIEYAAKKGWYIFLDDQIGRYTVEESMNRILPFLKYDNVHLAIDPEWKTLTPMETIGSVTADDVNKAQKMMNDYIIEHKLKGRRMFVIHQFKDMMIKNRAMVKTNFERVQLIHCSDGFGPPRLKKETYSFNAIAKNMPIKSFKLFLPTKVYGAGYDEPLMSPKDVMSLNPRPYFIMYQ
ncbi:MAG: hypothetical protein ACTTIZ_04450 [Treponema sp.]